MTKLTRLLKDYRESGALNSLVSVHAALDEPVFLTKGGELVAFLAVRGQDAECLDESQRDTVARRFQSALRIFDENFRLYQYLIKSDQPVMAPEAPANPILQEAMENRLEYFRDKQAALFSFDAYLAVVYGGWKQADTLTGRLHQLITKPRLAFREMLTESSRLTLLDTELDRAQEILRQKVSSLVVHLGDVVGLEVLDHERAFMLQRRLLNYTPYKAEGARLNGSIYADFQACDSGLECHRDYLRLDDHYVTVLTLKEPPAKTYAHLLRGLDGISANYIIASEWKPETSLKMRRSIQSKRRHFHNAKSSFLNYVTSNQEIRPEEMLIDDAAVAQVRDLGACLEEMDIQGHRFGEFSLTVILYNMDRDALKRSASECVKAFSSVDAHLVEERYNLLNAWMAALPGNHPFNLRRFWLLDTNYADLSFLFKPAQGERRNEHLSAEYLATLETNAGTPYFLNLHCQDVAHTLVLGATGSGKSFLLNFLLTHFQKYDPLTYVFDLGGSYESLTTLVGGSYVPMAREPRAVTINPFCLEPTPENLNFLFAFLKVLIESGGYAMTAADERDLYEQIESLYAIAPAERRLSTLSRILNRRLQASLQKWVQGGPYGAWFDNAADNLTLARFQAFDFEAMDKAPQLLEPLLFYILHRANAAIAGSDALKVFVMDEAWRFLRHDTTRRYILEALKTWRKKNGVMILATQSSADLFASDAVRTVLESCPTKIFLANPEIDVGAWRELFHLNETESAWIRRLVPKRQMLLKQPGLSKVLTLEVDPKSYWLYTNNPSDNPKRREAFERHGIKKGLEILTRGNS
jgi:type IV secretion system protein VirB4